jgi:hypothetical protein
VEPLDLDQLRFARHETTLYWRRAEVTESIPAAIRVNGSVEMQETIYGNTLLRLSAFVLGQKLPPHTETQSKTVTLKVPQTWVDHLLVEHGKHWPLSAIVRRRPPVFCYEEQTVELTATWTNWQLYPWCGIKMPKEKFGDAYNVRWIESTVSVTPEEQT